MNRPLILADHALEGDHAMNRPLVLARQVQRGTTR